jgi:hypothetical protein
MRKELAPGETLFVLMRIGSPVYRLERSPKRHSSTANLAAGTSVQRVVSLVSSFCASPWKRACRDSKAVAICMSPSSHPSASLASSPSAST